MNAELIYPNGIDAETGAPLLPTMPADSVASLARGNPIDLDELQQLQVREQFLQGEPVHGLMVGVEGNDLAQTGWGVVFADAGEQAQTIRDALTPLLVLRRNQAGALYRDELVDPRFAYRYGEASSRWLARNGGAPGGPRLRARNCHA